MTTERATDILIEQLKNRQYHDLREVFSEMHEVDIAAFIETLSEEQALIAFRTLPKDAEMEVFAELNADTQTHIIATISDEKLSEIVEDLMVDDVVDMLEEMPAQLVKRVLHSAKTETRNLINQFLCYPEYSAGSIMTAEYTDLKRTMTVEDAIKRIRRIGEDRETIYTCYVIDATRHLEGMVTVKDLLLAHDSTVIEELMDTDIISVTTTTDQEEAVTLMAKYDFMSLPVVDGENRLVGIVTVDDAVDIIQEEATEDFEKMAAMAPSEKPYLKTGVMNLARNRFLWLLVLMLSGMLSGAILGYYESVYSAIPLLVTFMPMLNGTGGNAGSQSSTLVIRGMALGEVRPKDILVVFWKELRVSLLMGFPLAVVNFFRIIIFYPGEYGEAFVVSLAMLFTVLLANSVGGILPMIAKRLNIDPAMMAAPLVTTIVDALSLVIYFSIAMFLLPF